MGKKKNKTQASDPNEKRKPGNQGKFSPKRVEFLNEHLSRYLEADAAHTTKSFFAGLISSYWEKFNWCFKALEEIPDGWTPPDSDDDLSGEEEKLKTESMQIVPGVSSCSSCCLL
jgi:hypothetical protein